MRNLTFGIAVGLMTIGFCGNISQYAVAQERKTGEKPANRDLGDIKKMKIDDLKSFSPTQFAVDLASLDILLNKKERNILQRVKAYKDYEKKTLDETKTNYEVINALFKKLAEELEEAKKHKKYTAKEVSMKDNSIVIPSISWDDEERTRGVPEGNYGGIIVSGNQKRTGSKKQNRQKNTEPSMILENTEMIVANSDYHTTLDRSLDSIETVQSAMKFLLKYSTTTK